MNENRKLIFGNFSVKTGKVGKLLFRISKFLIIGGERTCNTDRIMHLLIFIEQRKPIIFVFDRLLS